MKQMLRKGLLLLISTFLCVGLISSVAAQEEPVAADSSGTEEQGITESGDHEFTPITENSRLALSVDITTGNVAVRDKQNGQTWYAFPPDLEEGMYLESFSASVRSLLDVSYSYGGNTQVTVGTYDSQNAMSMRLFQLSDGIRLLFSYDGNGITFSVPLLIKLHEDYISCEVDYANLVEGSQVQIIKLMPLPNFGIAPAHGEGYAFLPDGSGILVYNKDAKGKSLSYEEWVYGSDPVQGLVASDDTTHTLNIRMPVYGFAREDSACLAVIHQGDATASIFSSMQYDYLKCGASFIYRESDLTGIQTKDQDIRMLNITSKIGRAHV